jgi:general stress protein 26
MEINMAKDESWRGKVGGMGDQEVIDFLAGNTVCRMGCLDGDGWPYVVPIWYEYNDDGFYLVPRERSIWAKYIQKDPRVSLCIDVADGLRKVMVKGTGEIVEEANVGGKWVDIATRMSVRYLGVNGPDYLAPTLPEPRWLIFVKPEKMVTWQGVDWAKRYKTTDWG